MIEKPFTDPDLQRRARELYPKLVLASSSPNRLSLLREAGIEVLPYPQDINEICGLERAEEVVMTLSREKLESYLASKDFDPSLPAIGIDTLVEFKDKLLGKPQNEEEARAMLSAFKGKTQNVFSGLSLYNKGEIQTVSVVSKVVFLSLTDAEIDSYLATGEWKGAAGGYRIQKNGWRLIDKIEGSWTNVIGLPLEKLCQLSSS